MEGEQTSPEQIVTINGVEMSAEMRADVLKTVVCLHVEGGDSFRMQLNAKNSLDQQLKWIDDEDLQPGNEIEVKFGYLGENTSMFVGEITALHVEFPSSDAVVVEVQGFDRLHRFRRGRKTRVFNEVKDSQIAETISSELGLGTEVEDSGVVHDYVVQNNLSDMDFLLERARRIRFELLVNNQQLIFRPAANALGETVQMEYPLDLQTFNVRMSAARQISEFAIRSWNPATKQALVGSGSASDVDSRMDGDDIGADLSESAFESSKAQISNMPVYSQAEADQIAKAKFNDMAVAFLCGEAETVGRTDIRAGETIRLTGLGQRFSGLYYITKAEHCIDPKIGYRTNFLVRRAGV